MFLAKYDSYLPKDEPYLLKDEPYLPKYEPYLLKDKAYLPKDEPSLPKDEPYLPKYEPYLPKDGASKGVSGTNGLKKVIFWVFSITISLQHYNAGIRFFFQKRTSYMNCKCILYFHKR